MKLDLSNYHTAVDSKSRGIKLLNDKPMLIYGLDILIVALYLILFLTTVLYWFNSCSSFIFPLIVLAVLVIFVVALLKQTNSDIAMKIRLASIGALIILLCLTTMMVSTKTACGMGICSGRDNVQDRIDRVVMKINRRPSQCNILYDEEDDTNDGRRGRSGENDNEDDRKQRRMNDDRKNVVSQNINNSQQSQQSEDILSDNTDQSLSSSNTDKLIFQREINEGNDREGDDDVQRYHTQNDRNGGDSDENDDDYYSSRQGQGQNHLNIASAFFCKFYDEVYPSNDSNNNNNRNTAPANSGCIRIIKESTIFKNPELSLLRVLIIFAALILILILADMFLLRRNKINEEQQDIHINDTPLITLDHRQEQPFQFNNETTNPLNGTLQMQQQQYQQLNQYNNNNNNNNNNNHFNI